MDVIKSKEGVMLTKRDEIKNDGRSNQHFLEVLNRPTPEDTGEFDDEDFIPESEPIIDVDPAKAEIYAAFKEMRNETAGGVDSLTFEILKTDLEPPVDFLRYFLQKVWKKEQIPED